MRLHFIAVAISLILRYLNVVMLVPVIVALYFKDFYSCSAFLLTMLINFILSVLLNPKKIDADLLNDIKKSEALAIVAFSWICISLLSAIPYLFYGLSPVNAL
ncbi:MAG: hypothetical protein ACI37T_03730, partial [Candidatus Gastranaerophilaceae bacterium]